MKHSLPFLSGLKIYFEQKVYPFHTPGHKGGRGILPEFAELLENALPIDVSLMNELDDLHEPKGILQKAQLEAAQLYGADESFFCVNGTTGAIHAMILGSIQPGDKILVPRNAHCSVAGALVLSGAEPIYVWPDFDEKFSIAGQVTPQSIEQQFELHQDIKAVLVTSPNYYGLAADLEAIARLVHRHGAVLLVDEAHGPHLGFCESLPISALQTGADACAQSTHKIVGAMTQCSVLHVKKGRIDLDKIRQVCSLLATTSPNQLLLASLDAAFAQLAASGKAMAEKALALALHMRAGLAQLENIKVLQYDSKYFDSTKVTVNVTGLGLTGYQAADLLREQGLAVELADKANILFLVTYADNVDAIDKAVQAVGSLPKMQHFASVVLPRLPKTEMVLSPREAFFSPQTKKLLAEATGCVSAEEIKFYPPGVPLVLPGEKITAEILAYFRAYASEGDVFAEKYINVVR